MRGCMVVLTRGHVRRWASPLHLAFDWGGFESLKYARTGWRDTPLAPFDGVVCDPTHLSAQNLLDGIHAVLSPSPSRTHADAHAMEAVLSRTHAQAQGRQALLDSTPASTPAHALLSRTHESRECASESERSSERDKERESASESERSQSSESESAIESERRESRESEATHVTRHNPRHGHSKEEARHSIEEARDGHWKEEAREASGQKEASGHERRGRSRWPAGRFGDYAFAVCNLCQRRRLDCGCRDVSLA